MLLARENGGLKVFAETYSLEFATDRPYVYVENGQGDRVAELFILSSIHPLNGRDDTAAAGPWAVEEQLDQVTFSIVVTSSAWKSKTIRFRCMPARFTYEVEVEGQGAIAEAVYFGGYYSAQIRWGSGMFWSGQRFTQGFNPEPTCDEVYTFPAEANSAINMTGVPLPGKSDWFFTPPPFCFAFDTGKNWLGMGVEAKPGGNQYTEFQYHGGRGAFYLSLSYEGYTHVEGHYILPAISFQFGPDPYTLLVGHVQQLRAGGMVPNQARDPRPEWWSEPIFCGWGAQNNLSRVGGGKAIDFANQSSYEAFLHTLTDQKIIPGTIVLDDKWQVTYGDNEVDTSKWPDLPGFIHSRHENGQRVLLWLKAWSPEGIPLQECITNAAGLPAAVDPTNPAFEQRLRESVRRMISAEGYNADGFKIDFTARVPSGPGLTIHQPVWGLELMRLYLGIIRDEARRVKPDAMIITHTPHPYLSDLMDAVRLNDINTGHDICRQMTHRARIAAIACPEALIDMDNWPVANKAAWKSYLNIRPFLGIPALYFSSHIDSTGEPLTESDFAAIRSAWDEYRAALNQHRRRPAAEKVNELGGMYLPETNGMVKRLALASTLPVATKPLKAWQKDYLPGEEENA